MPVPTSRKVLTTTVAGRMLGVTAVTIKRYLAAGQLEGFTLPGGYKRVYEDSVVKLMKDRAPEDLETTPW